MDLEAQYDKLYRYCYFQCKDVQAAEDVVQETFLRWLEHYPGQKEREAIPTLYTIARNLCVDLARQRTHLPLRESDRQTPDPAGDWAEKWDLERVLARLCLIGTFHAVLLLALTLLLGGSQGLSLGRTGAYLLAPYLLTAWGSLWLSRRLRGREVLYGATALAVLASGSYSAAVFLADDLFALGALPWWSLAIALLAAALIGEGIAFAKRIKEDTWNLSFET